MAIEKISVKTLRQEVYDQLRDKIISAEILPGQTISLRELAQKFGVSLMPVREALWQLESERIIVIESNKRIRVNTLTAKEMEEALRLRLMLESTAAERACDLRPEEAVPRVERLLKAMETSVDRPKIFMRRNTQFHFSIYSYADSPLLLEIINRLWARVFPYVFTHFFITQDNSKAMKRHWKMFQGLAERNKKKLTDALREDLEAAAAVIIPALEKSSSHRTH
ncbi:MAG: GntR family transcriptional regulator [Thermodesulfobacteriota bacterium]|jgi:DNA-binding GntR family transcriptional regulator